MAYLLKEVQSCFIEGLWGVSDSNPPIIAVHNQKLLLAKWGEIVEYNSYGLNWNICLVYIFLDGNSIWLVR